MSIFRDFFVKEKPVFTGITRGIGGFGFGGGGGGAGDAGVGSATGGTTTTDWEVVQLSRLPYQALLHPH